MKNIIPEIINLYFFGISGWKNDVCYYYRFMLVRPEIVNYEIIKNFSVWLENGTTLIISPFTLVRPESLVKNQKFKILLKL